MLLTRFRVLHNVAPCPHYGGKGLYGYLYISTGRLDLVDAGADLAINVSAWLVQAAPLAVNGGINQ